MTVQTKPLKNKVLFFDIDGTLVDDETKKAPDSLYEAMRLAKENTKNDRKQDNARSFHGNARSCA